MLATPRKHGPKKLINTMHVLASICGHIYSATQHAWNIRCKQIDMYEREREIISVNIVAAIICSQSKSRRRRGRRRGRVRSGPSIGNTGVETSGGGGFQGSGSGGGSGGSGGKFGWRWRVGAGPLSGATLTARAMGVAATNGAGAALGDEAGGRGDRW